MNEFLRQKKGECDLLHYVYTCQQLLLENTRKYIVSKNYILK